MAEIPMTGGGNTLGARPKEVTYAAWLILIESIVGLIIGGAEYAIWGNELSLLGAVLAIVGFWLYFQILNQDYSAWNMAVIFNVIAVFLYAVGDNWPGVILSVICFIYLIQPNVKVHFKK
ncbi:MAG: hypothetical protein ACTSW7_02585 [Candidatus Thorarchaeota archaeon]